MPLVAIFILGKILMGAIKLGIAIIKISFKAIILIVKMTCRIVEWMIDVFAKCYRKLCILIDHHFQNRDSWCNGVVNADD